MRFALLFTFVTGLASASLIQNGGFESPAVPPGTFGPSTVDFWTLGGASGDGIFLQSYLAFSLPSLGGEGVQALGFGSLGNSGQWAQQTFNTTPGDTYSVSFEYLVQQSPIPNPFNEEWTVEALDGPGPVDLFTHSQTFNNTDWATYSFDFTAVGSSSTIRFTDLSATLGPDHNSVNWALDAVSVTDVGGSTSTVPEPSPAVLVVTCLVALAFIRRRLKFA